MTPFFSVVVPTHKRKNQLLDLLTTLDLQSFDKKRFEVIVVATQSDDALNIPTHEFLFSLQIITIPQDPLNGKSASAKRNYGVTNAKGEWIAFTDDDCLTDKDWLKNAELALLNNKSDFMEGFVNIPEPEVKTFTYKGIKRLSQSGGYQTCNMFYKKKDFVELKGFDPNFPFYLEDTDLAWTFIENNKAYYFAKDVIVSHPVPPAQTSKMLDSAIRMEKIPYLYKKHPKTYLDSTMRAYSRPYLILLLIDLSLFCSILFLPPYLLALLMTRLLFTKFLLIRMMKDCVFSAKEGLEMYYYLMICPLISFVFLIKGNIKNRVWIFFK